MKVLQILPELNSGGVERGTLEVARHLIAAGHEAVVVSNGGRLVPALEELGARHIVMPVHKKRLSSLLQVRPFRRLLEQEKPDIIHIRSRVPGWIAWLAWRKMDPRTRPHFVSTVHGFYSVNAYSRVMTRGERVIAVSESVRDYILQNYPDVTAERIRVIPRGVELERYPCGFRPDRAWLERWQREQPQCAGKVVLLLPGRITRLKGHEDFFALVAGLKAAGVPAHGLVAGDTHPKKRAYLAELRERAGVLGVGTDITFLGHRTDVREIMAVSDITLSLSQQPESFGRVALEALAMGKFFVGYDHGGIGEQLNLFFPAGRVKLGDTAGLLRVVMEVVSGSPVPAAVGEPFTLRSMCEGTLRVYEELATKP